MSGIKKETYWSIEQQSVVLITSKNPENREFGSGFLIMQKDNNSFVLTCSHVLDRVGGESNITVGIHNAEVVAKGSRTEANDLAVLKIQGLIEKPIIPLSECGKEKARFRILGYWMYDIKDEGYKLDSIYGYLFKKVGLRKGKQVEDTVAWEIKPDQESSLEPGYSGSPIIDEKAGVAFGVVSHKLPNGIGQAICIQNLRQIWPNIPMGLLRAEIYDLDAVSQLALEVLNEHPKPFIKKLKFHYPGAFKHIDLNLRVNSTIEFIIVTCNQKNNLKEFLRIIGKVDKRKLRKFLVNYELDLSHFFEKSSFTVYLLKIRHKVSLLFSFLQKAIFKPRSHKKEDVSTQADITTPGQYPESPEITEAKVRALAASLGYPREAIKVVFLKKGSVKIRIELPSKALDKLISLYETDQQLMERLGLLYVEEKPKDRFLWENVRKLFSSFGIREVISIYETQLGSNFDSSTFPNDAELVIKGFIQHIDESSETSALLGILSNHNPTKYKLFAPYFRVPKRPAGRPGARRLTSNSSQRSELTRGRIILAIFLGTCVGAVGSLVLIALSLFLIHIDVAYYFPEMYELTRLLALVLIGNYVGRTVAKVTRRRGGDFIGRIAVFSYLLGLFFIPIFLLSLVILILILLFILDFSLAVATVRDIYTATSSEFGVDGILGAIVGSLLAYQRSR